jgi:hypothetical protein
MEAAGIESQKADSVIPAQVTTNNATLCRHRSLYLGVRPPIFADFEKSCQNLWQWLHVLGVQFWVCRRGFFVVRVADPAGCGRWMVSPAGVHVKRHHVDCHHVDLRRGRGPSWRIAWPAFHHGPGGSRSHTVGFGGQSAFGLGGRRSRLQAPPGARSAGGWVPLSVLGGEGLAAVSWVLAVGLNRRRTRIGHVSGAVSPVLAPMGAGWKGKESVSGWLAVPVGVGYREHPDST